VREQGAGERRGFEYRDVVRFGEPADARGKEIGAFRDHGRGAHRVVVAQRDREMRRVGHDDIGFRHFGHHALARGGALLRADRGFDLRVAFGLAVLALHLFERHAELLRVLPELERHVERDDQDHHAGNGEHTHHDEVAERPERARERLAREREHLVARLPQHDACDAADERRLHDRLGELDETFRGKHAPESRGGADAVEFGHEGGGRKRPAAHCERRHQGCDHRRGEKRRTDRECLDAEVVQARAHRRGIAHCGRVEREAVGDQALQAFYGAFTRHPHRGEGGHQHGERGKLRRARDIALFARLLEAPR
jgi:hypothetical protein